MLLMSKSVSGVTNSHCIRPSRFAFVTNRFFGRDFARGLAFTAANPDQGQQPPAEHAKWVHDGMAIHPDKPRQMLCDIALVRREQIGPVPYDVLEEMKIVPTPQNMEQAPPKPLSGPPADLKVDQVRPLIVTDDDVFALVQVPVGDAAPVHFVESGAKLREEIIVDSFIRAERVAFDVSMRCRMGLDDTSDGDRTAGTRKIGKVCKPP